MAIACGVAVLLALAAVVVESGTQLGKVTWLEVACVVGGAALVGVSVALRPNGTAYGAGALAAFGLLFVLTALSVIWSLQPDETWREANRLTAYLAVFAGGIAVVRLAAQRWRALLLGLLGGLALISLFALLSKVFPGTLAEDQFYARLSEPFGYWNALGVAAAMGVPLTLWLGARREAHPAEAIAAYPLLLLFGLVIMLSYSRASLLAAIVATALWIGFVPLRLRSAGMLAVAALFTAAVSGFAFARDPLNADGTPIAQRSDAGTEFGLLLILAFALAAAAGWAMLLYLRDGPRPTPDQRELIGRAGLGTVATVAVVGVLALLVSGGGPGERWRDLTSEKTERASIRTDPGRLATSSNLRGSYWREAGRIWADHRLRGAGPGTFATVRLRYRRSSLAAAHAHGWFPQTLADLGLAGLAASLLLLVAWGIAARRPLFPAGGASWSAERAALLAVGALVLAFGVHSVLDWSWFVPGVALPALFAAGWLAGRGPLAASAVRSTGSGIDGGSAPSLDAGPGQGPPLRGLALAAVIAALAIGALCALYSIIQPWRASERTADALELARDEGKLDEARAATADAERMDELSVEPVFDRAAIETQAGNLDQAERFYKSAVRLQPANPETWFRLGRLQVQRLHHPDDAQRTLSAAAFLNPRDPEVMELYIVAYRMIVHREQQKQIAAQQREQREEPSRERGGRRPPGGAKQPRRR